MTTDMIACAVRLITICIAVAMFPAIAAQNENDAQKSNSEIAEEPPITAPRILIEIHTESLFSGLGGQLSRLMDCKTAEKCSDDKEKPKNEEKLKNKAHPAASKAGREKDSSKKTVRASEGDAQKEEKTLTIPTIEKLQRGNRDVEKRSEAKLKKVQDRAQEGLTTVLGNMGKAWDAMESIAPEISPQAVSEDDVELESFKD